MATWPELLLLAVSPSVFLLWFFYHKDRYEHEPVLFILKVFLLGALSVIPAAVIEFLVGSFILSPEAGIIEGALFFFIVVGPVEEGGKFAAVRVRAYGSREFDEPMDGIVLGVSAALGFATVENILTVFAAPTLATQIATGIVRAFLSVPGHAFWGAITGFYLGQAKYLRRPGLKFAGLGIAALLHATYDTTATVFDATAGESVALGIFGLLVLGGIVWFAYFKIVKPEISTAESESPYKNAHVGK